jgi:ArsR family transcriptional regulator, lead/cadmium/zinc/bismuth-responsive transcriptional repressor
MCACIGAGVVKPRSTPSSRVAPRRRGTAKVPPTLAAAAFDHASLGALAETFRILGDTTRVRILDAISTSERCVQDIARLVGLSESAVSHQLRLLRGHRLVRPRRAGRQVFYALDDHHIVGLFAQGLEHVRERAQMRALAQPGRMA